LYVETLHGTTSLDGNPTGNARWQQSASCARTRTRRVARDPGSHASPWRSTNPVRRAALPITHLLDGAPLIARDPGAVCGLFAPLPLPGWGCQHQERRPISTRGFPACCKYPVSTGLPGSVRQNALDGV